jgi:hypothetical protein
MRPKKEAKKPKKEKAGSSADSTLTKGVSITRDATKKKG